MSTMYNRDVKDYLTNISNTGQYFQNSNNVPLQNIADKYPSYNSANVTELESCPRSFPGSYPPQNMETYANTGNDQYSNNYSNNSNNYNNYDSGRQILQSSGENILEDYNSFIPSNDPNSRSMVNISGRPVWQTSVNDMVPYASKFTQNMAGTGVLSAIDIEGNTFDGGFDQTTPYQTKLGAFTGSDDTYLHKRETGPMYSPAEQQTGYVYGAPIIRPDMDQYTQSMITRRDLKPVEPIKVGPGLDIDPNMPASGGFHDFTRILPNNVSDYKANQLEGRVNAGRFVTGAELPTSNPGIGVMGQSAPGVTKNRSQQFYDQTRRPTMSNKAGFISNEAVPRSQWTVDFRPGNSRRDQISYGLGTPRIGIPVNNNIIVPGSYNNGNINTSNINGNQQRPQYRPGQQNQYSVNVDGPVIMEGFDNVDFSTVDNYYNYNIDEEFNTNENDPQQQQQQQQQQQPDIVDTVGISPAALGGLGLGPSRSLSYMSMDNNIRSHSDINSIPVNGPSAYVPNTGAILENYYVNETGRGTVAPENISQLNLTGHKIFNNTSYNDPQRTTTKETTAYAYSGNAQRSKDGSKFKTWTDDQKTTTKETTSYAYSGNAQRSKDGAKFKTWTDDQKTTTKETTAYAYSGNAQRSKDGAKFYTWKDAPKVTIKQSTHYSRVGGVGGAGSGVNNIETSRFMFLGESADVNEFVVDIDGNISEVKKPEEYGNNGYYNISNNSEDSGSLDSHKAIKILSKSEVKPGRGVRIGGARTDTIRGSTLVVDYVPGAGRENILNDPDVALGKTTHRFNTNIDNGPGSLSQAIPTATSSQQVFQILAVPRAPVNKLTGNSFDRSLASYQVEHLKNNPLSIYTNNPTGEIPNLYGFNKPDTFSPMVPDSPSTIEENFKILDSQPFLNMSAANIYPPQGNNQLNSGFNPVMNIIDGFGYTDGYNPMLNQGSSRTVKEATFNGGAYSGKFVDDMNINKVYGSDTYRPKSRYDLGLEENNKYVCSGIDALSGPSRPYIINRDLY